ncbi:hypothetical protein Avbf_16404 [Armadillidium vulgare]|nr:hypothetical protein Avbf_16404 [Armadillidium vulgare]
MNNFHCLLSWRKKEDDVSIIDFISTGIGITLTSGGVPDERTAAPSRNRQVREDSMIKFTVSCSSLSLRQNFLFLFKY